MKVSEVLKNFDFMGKIKILEYYIDNSGEEESFKGAALDCPWIYAEMNVDTNENGEGIFVGIDDGDTEPYLGIFVRED